MFWLATKSSYGLCTQFPVLTADKSLFPVFCLIIFQRLLWCVQMRSVFHSDDFFFDVYVLFILRASGAPSLHKLSTEWVDECYAAYKGECVEVGLMSIFILCLPHILNLLLPSPPCCVWLTDVSFYNPNLSARQHLRGQWTFFSC